MNAIASVVPRKLEHSFLWCDRCVLRNGCGFEDFSQEELAFMIDLKIGHGRAWAGEVIIDGTPQKPRCYTLFSGWAVRCRLLPGGQRHVVGILLPGDTIGLHAALCGVSDEIVEAVTDVTFCVLHVGKLRELFSVKGLADRIARMLAWENLQLANRLAVTGACSARVSLAHLICDLHARLAQRRLAQGLSFKLPLSLKQLAEVLGLTPVHLHRVLRGFRKDELFVLENKTVTILDYTRLTECGPSGLSPVAKAPFL